MEQNQPNMAKRKEEEESEVNELLFNIMEGYSDKFIAPLSHFSLLMEDASNAAVVEAKRFSLRKRPSAELVTEMNREIYRRRKMAESFDLLQSMVPNLLPKAKRENVVDETIAYILTLEKEITRLEELKRSYETTLKVAEGKMIQYSNKSSSINVTVSNNDNSIVFFGIQSLVRPRLVTDIFMVFNKHMAEVLAANVAVNQRQLTLTVTAAVVNENADVTIGKIRRDILNL